MDTTVVLKIRSQSDLDALIIFLRGTNIESSISNLEQIDEMNPSSDKCIYIPTNEFKEFCGKENLNQFGHISLNHAIECVLNYAARKKLTHTAHFNLDSVLREALSIDSNIMLHSTLYTHLRDLFKLSI